jgi:hypothetical protein
MRRPRSAALALALAILTVTAEAQNGFLQLFPELNRLPAPAWVAEGVRLTFSAAAASIGFETEIVVGSGAGFTSVDVVAVDRNLVVLEVASWGKSAGAVVLLAKHSYAGLPSRGGEFWLHPDVLREATDKAGGTLQIVRMQTTAHGKSYDVVRFQDETEDYRYVQQFDLVTGILVSAATRVGAADGKRSQTHTEFISRRRIDRPWVKQAAPGWLATVRGFTLQGQLSTAIPGVPSMGGQPLRGTATVKRRGARWHECDVATSIGSSQWPAATTEVTEVSGIAQVGGLWLPPAGLAALRNGQVLDEDPIVGIRQAVTAADGRWVAISSGSPADSTEFVYEVASGQLVRFRRTQQIGIATQILDVTVERR